jgi:hypothetical protein
MRQTAGTVLSRHKDHLIVVKLTCVFKGTVKFGGTVSYAGQNAWLQNATVRENICFGRPFIEEKYWDAVRRSCLEQDLEMWPHGDLTEVGEKVSLAPIYYASLTDL